MRESNRMMAMVLERPREPLRLCELDVPVAGPGQVRVRVLACGVCRTDLHVVDGELEDPVLPLVPGHEIVGVIDAVGAGVSGLSPGDRVGIPWLGRTCGDCRFCTAGQENLCDDPGFTGYTLPGGYAEYTVADGRYCFPLDSSVSAIEAAPLLCAGLIGYRSYRAAGDPGRLGLYGFGAAAHILAQLAVYEGREVFAFTRPGDAAGQSFARDLGAAWVGDSSEQPPLPLDAAIIFAPVGDLVPAALASVRKGGAVVCAGIYMSDIPAFPYQVLWGERSIRSVANLTRRDGIEFLDIAPRAGIRTAVSAYPLAEANRALDDVRAGRVQGAAVLAIGT